VVELSSAEVASLSPLSLAHASAAQLQTLVEHHADTLKQLCSASVEMCQFWQGVSSSSSSSSSSSPPSGVTAAKIELGGALGDLQQMAEAAARRQVTALSATVMELVQQHMSADLGDGWGQLSWVERWEACLAVRERLGAMDPRARTCTPGHTGAEARAQWVHLLRGRPPIVNPAGADMHGEDTLLLQKPATPRRLARAQWREARHREKAEAAAVAALPPTGSLQPPRLPPTTTTAAVHASPSGTASSSASAAGKKLATQSAVSYSQADRDSKARHSAKGFPVWDQRCVVRCRPLRPQLVLSAGTCPTNTCALLGHEN
jgi:hypothetical protein